MLKLKKFHRPNIVQHFHHFIRVFLTRQDWVDFGRATSGKQNYATKYIHQNDFQNLRNESVLLFIH